jgi:uncharacterized protein YidB (DUF937 family)
MSIVDRLVNHVIPGVNLQEGQGMQLIRAVLQLVHDHPGGMAGLMQDFEKSGLVKVSKSWVSTGTNIPLSVEDMQKVISQQQTAEVARQSSMTHEQAQETVASVLPKLIDALTPNGQLPDNAEAAKALEVLKSTLLK